MSSWTSSMNLLQHLHKILLSDENFCIIHNEFIRVFYVFIYNMLTYFESFFCICLYFFSFHLFVRLVVGFTNLHSKLNQVLVNELLLANSLFELYLLDLIFVCDIILVNFIKRHLAKKDLFFRFSCNFPYVFIVRSQRMRFPFALSQFIQHQTSIWISLLIFQFKPYIVLTLETQG